MIGTILIIILNLAAGRRVADLALQLGLGILSRAGDTIRAADSVSS
jgi:hypothetical protein